MANIENFGTPNGSPGILHPVIANKFRMVYGNLNAYRLLTFQTSRVETDLVNGQMLAEIEQPMGHGQELINLITSLAKRTIDLRLQMFDGDENVMSEVAGFGTLIQHRFVMDYAVNKTATHYLVFDFKPSVI